MKQLPRSGRSNSGQSKLCKFIRDAVAVLERLCVLAAELVFTAAAFYGLYHVFRASRRERREQIFDARK